MSAWTDLPALPEEKVQGGPGTTGRLTASEFNDTTTAISDLRSALKSLLYAQLEDGSAEAVSASGKIKLRLNAGVLEWSYNGAAYAAVPLTATAPLSVSASGVLALAAAVAGVSAGSFSAADKTKLDAITGTHTGSSSGTNTGDQVAGTGLTGTTTLNVIANADGSIVANANDIQVGVLATDAQHGNRGGGGIHSNAIAAGAAGFMTGADKTKLDAITGTHTGTNTGDQTLVVDTFGSTPDAKGASATGTMLIALQPADETHPGCLAMGDQTLPLGQKRFEANVTGTSVIKVRNQHATGLSASGYYDESNVFQVIIGYDNNNNVSFVQSTGSFNFVVNGLNRGQVNTSGVFAWGAGGITVSGVVVPTVSSNETQTNKTFTSPVINGATFSGTLAAGTSTFSGTPTFSGVVTFGAAKIVKAATGITAFAGGGQGSATSVPNQINFVTTVASANDSVKLPTAVLGLSITVYNLGANACNVYPQTGGAIDALGTNGAYSLAAGGSRTFDGQSATQYRSR